MSEDLRPIRRALLSVSDKTGLIDFARGLIQNGAEIVSTGGTARKLKEGDVPVISVEAVTGFPEIFDGRVKTLHPLIHGGILWRRDNKKDGQQVEENDLRGIDLVAVVLYKFEEASQKIGLSKNQVLEEIDIGGPTLLRAAAKNHAWVASVSSPDQYGAILGELKDKGGLSIKTRADLAKAAFARTAAYDAAITDWLRSHEKS